jgi:hypothetical protein
MRILDIATWVEEAPGLGALLANARMRPEDQSFEDYGFRPAKAHAGGRYPAGAVVF